MKSAWLLSAMGTRQDMAGGYPRFTKIPCSGALITSDSRIKNKNSLHMLYLINTYMFVV